VLWWFFAYPSQYFRDLHQILLQFRERSFFESCLMMMENHKHSFSEIQRRQNRITTLKLVFNTKKKQIFTERQRTLHYFNSQQEKKMNIPKKASGKKNEYS